MSTVMDVYQLIRDLIEDAKKAQNADMVSQLIDIKLILSDIQDENKLLKKELEQSQNVERHTDGNYITLKDDELHIKYCSTCWGNDRKLIQLMKDKRLEAGVPNCPICLNNWLKARNSGN